jgi:hypothetical protein
MQTEFVGGTPFGRVVIMRISSLEAVYLLPPSLCVYFKLSAILTVITQGDWAIRVESLTNAEVQKELMDVLRIMFPDVDNIPEPNAIHFHRWHRDRFTRGAYSNWPASYFEGHLTNVRATVSERVWFTGEHCSRERFVCVSFFAIPLSLIVLPFGLA